MTKKRVISKKEFRVYSRAGDNKLLFDLPDIRLERARYASQGIRPLGEQDTYIIGDLNANGLKMLHFLAIAGLILDTATTRTIFTRIHAWYKNLESEFGRKMEDGDFLNRTDFEVALADIEQRRGNTLPDILALVDRLKIEENRAKSVRLIFIGDMLSDRGVSDSLVLQILDLLKRYEVNYEITFSNHDLDFFKMFSNGKLSNKVSELYKPMSAIVQHWSYDCHNPSIQGKMERIYKDSYLPHLCLIAFDNLYDGDEKSKCIVTHTLPLTDNLWNLEVRLCDGYNKLKPDDRPHLRLHPESPNGHIRPLIESERPKDEMGSWENYFYDINQMFRSLCVAYLDNDDKEFLQLSKSTRLNDFVWYRPNKEIYPQSIHPNILSVFGHDTKMMAIAEKASFKKGTAFKFLEKRQGDAKEFDFVANKFVDIAPTDIGNYFCIDNNSGQPYSDTAHLPHLIARVATTEVSSLSKNERKESRQQLRIEIDKSIAANNRIGNRFTTGEIDGDLQELVTAQIVSRLTSAARVYIGNPRGRLQNDAGLRRAEAFLSRVSTCKTLNEIIGVMNDLGNKRIDAAAGINRIHGIKVNAGSLMTTLISNLYESPLAETYGIRSQAPRKREREAILRRIKEARPRSSK